MPRRILSSDPRHLNAPPPSPCAAQDVAKSPVTYVGVDILEDGPGSFTLYSCPRTFISPASRVTLFTCCYHSSPIIFLPCFLSPLRDVFFFLGGVISNKFMYGTLERLSSPSRLNIHVFTLPREEIFAAPRRSGFGKVRNPSLWI